jgi:hypothetical protein
MSTARPAPPPKLDRRRTARLLLAVVAGIVASAALVAGLAAAGSPPEPPYVSLGLASATSDADGTVVLHLYASNATADPFEGTLAVRLNEPAAPATDLWTSTIRADPRGSGLVDVTLPGVCGRRLSARLAASDVERSLLLLVPCSAGAGGAP